MATHRPARRPSATCACPPRRLLCAVRSPPAAQIGKFTADPTFTHEGVSRVSGAAAGMCKWVFAMETYGYVAKDVGPKRAKLKAAQVRSWGGGVAAAAGWGPLLLLPAWRTREPLPASYALCALLCAAVRACMHASPSSIVPCWPCML